jgi:uracil-DNA glycosylase family 4
VTGRRFASPVPPGSGWPGDPASPQTPVAADPDDIAELARTAAGPADLDARVSVCRACPRLVGWREQVATAKRRAYADQPYWGRPITGWGDERAWLLVLGLAPAAHGGNRTGRIFTGDRSGDWLFAALHRAGLADLPTSTAAGDGQRLTGVRIAAAVRCAPPANKPDPAETAACAPWLEREVELLTPTLRAVLALGRFAWDAGLRTARRLHWQQPARRVAFGHGAVVPFRLPGAGAVSMIGSYHVSQQNTFTGRLTAAMLDDVLVQARQAGPP